MDTVNNDVAKRYFDLVQNEIKGLISQDEDLSPEQVDNFNKLIFQQDIEIQDSIRKYIDNASRDNLDIKRVAKNIYNEFKLQVKNNYFNKDEINDIPNKLMKERHIKTFGDFINEGLELRKSAMKYNL